MAPCFEFGGKSLEIETRTWSEFLNRGRTIVEQIPTSEEINKSRRAGLSRVEVRSRKVNHLSKVV